MSITPEQLTKLPGKPIAGVSSPGQGKMWIFKVGKQDVKAWRGDYPDADKWETIPEGLEFELKDSKFNPGESEIWIKSKPKGQGGNRGGGGGQAKSDPVKNAMIDHASRLKNATEVMSMAVQLAIASGQVEGKIDMPAIQGFAHELARAVLDIAAQLKRSGDGA